jgi:hypothetical protein
VEISEAELLTPTEESMERSRRRGGAGSVNCGFRARWKRRSSRECWGRRRADGPRNDRALHDQIAEAPRRWRDSANAGASTKWVNKQSRARS